MLFTTEDIESAEKTKLKILSVVKTALDFHNGDDFRTANAQTKRPPGNWAAFSSRENSSNGG